MSNNNKRFADSTETLKRKAALDRLIDILFEPDLRPLFISDEASIFDVSGDTEDELVSKIQLHYGRTLQIDELRLPVWRLLDLLGEPGRL